MYKIEVQPVPGCTFHEINRINDEHSAIFIADSLVTGSTAPYNAARVTGPNGFVYFASKR